MERILTFAMLIVGVVALSIGIGATRHVAQLTQEASLPAVKSDRTMSTAPANVALADKSGH
ncbi:hypothetical protein BH09PSE6_BH09PSE6_25250 [soil metagenome]